MSFLGAKSSRTLSYAGMAVLCLLGTLLLGLGVWAADEATDEPSSTIEGVADLDPVGDGSGSGRVEIVQTGNRVWLKLQVRKVSAEGALLVMATANPEEPLVIPVNGDGDYSLPSSVNVPTEGVVDLRRGGVALLAGRLEPNS